MAGMTGFENALYKTHYNLNMEGFRNATSECPDLAHYEDMFTKYEDDIWYGAVFVVPEAFGTGWCSRKAQREQVDVLTHRLGEFIASKFSDLLRGSEQLQMAWIAFEHKRKANVKIPSALDKLYKKKGSDPEGEDVSINLPIEVSLAWDEDAKCSFLIVDGKDQERSTQDRALGVFSGLLIREAAAQVVAEWRRQNSVIHSTFTKAVGVAPDGKKANVSNSRGMVWNRTLFCTPWNTIKTNSWSSPISSRGLLDLVTPTSG